MRNRRRWPKPVFDHGEPIIFLSVVPIAGVVLIAATLLAMTYKPPTHAVTFDLPQPYPWLDEAPALPVNTLGLTKTGQRTWNGQAFSEAEVLEMLRDNRRRPVEPILRFEPDPDASYGDAARLLALVEFAGVSWYRLCFASAFAFREYEVVEAQPTSNDGRPTPVTCDPRNHTGPPY
ncbi:MAG: hypothetical protein WBA68_10640 [Alteraurantiacibacter sp.]